MRYTRMSDEDEVVALFLRTEIASERYAERILAILARDGRARRIIDRPDLGDVAENTYRRTLLAEFRGYGRNAELFAGFPDDVRWHGALLHRDELPHVRYIDYSYWNALSGGSRLIGDGARTIAAGIEIYGVSNEGFWQWAAAMRAGAVFPELILVAEEESSPLVVLEGHGRLTAYCLAFPEIPEELPAIVGYSRHISRWAHW